MPKPRLDELELRSRDLARQHGLEEYLLTQFGMSQTLYAYALQDTNGYHFIVPGDDGSELERRTIQQADDILFWVISDAANRAALGRLVSVDPKNRRRKMWFDRELQIPGRIAPEWEKRRTLELDRVLRAQPDE
jgi:hypothetical protein